ncbi:MAG: DAK2 domain-containing protein [Bacteroidales bacterium]|nr:DAK2 domain-containing protein [Bacteroidales bacterium]
MKTSTITSACYLAMVRRGCARLHSSKDVINDLNVFPIPDGDTGDNMFMTINSGCQNSNLTESLGETAKSISSGMLLGARGNSGVILSRIFAGIGRGLSGLEKTDLAGFKAALAAGVEESYKAVSVPVEGTILTVFREGVENAADKKADCLEEYFAALIPEMEASLERTPDLLPTLKEAGVIDSGGAGILSIVRGMAEALEATDDVDLPDNPAPEAAHGKVDLSAFGPDDVLEFGYCTEFLLRLQSSKVDLATFDESEIRDYLTSVGESVVCFREDSIVKVHVHTHTPGDILNHCQRWGEYLTLKIENMALQHNETQLRKAAEEPEFKIQKHYGVVTVASGEGLVQTFLEAGADEVIRGGQTMNPSAQDFIDAFKRLGAEIVFVYPNNSNIVLTALQAASMFEDSKVIVIPTKTIGAGYVGIASLDKSNKDTDALVEEQKETVAGVTCGMVSKANRDTELNGVAVKEGDYIGICGGEVVCDNPSCRDALYTLCDQTEAGDHDVAVVFYGQDVPAEEADEVAAALQAKYPMTEFMFINGGQPVYNYILTLC